MLTRGSGSACLLELAVELWEDIKCEFYREELRDLSDWVAKHPDTWIEHAKLKADLESQKAAKGVEA